jgi:type I restriction enzyme M protein
MVKATTNSGQTTPEVESNQIPEGQLIDFISERLVPATPEEREAVQVLAHKLVEDYAYPKIHIRTRPQFRVKESPSGRERWPVDIAVFRSANQIYENVYI